MAWEARNTTEASYRLPSVKGRPTQHAAVKASQSTVTVLFPTACSHHPSLIAAQIGGPGLLHLDMQAY
jgi:hypothetical protein